jgi:hypothetical protein
MSVFMSANQLVRKLIIRYAGGTFVFNDRHSLTHWDIPQEPASHNVSLFVLW